MEFFGYTECGPQVYIRDSMRSDYKEPTCKEQVAPLMEQLRKISTCPEKFIRPDAQVIRIIDCYIGRVNGFAYGSSARLKFMKKKGVIKPVGPSDMHRIPPTTSVQYGWFLCDPVLTNEKWFLTRPRYPQPASPNTLILDKVRKNNKYATLF